MSRVLDKYFIVCRQADLVLKVKLTLFRLVFSSVTSTLDSIKLFFQFMNVDSYPILPRQLVFDSVTSNFHRLNKFEWQLVRMVRRAALNFHSSVRGFINKTQLYRFPMSRGNGAKTQEFP